MENNVALNFREIADKFNADKEERKKNRHKEAIEERILPYLEGIAKAGSYKTEIGIPTEYDICMFKEQLIEMGFEVNRVKNYRALAIAW